MPRLRTLLVDCSVAAVLAALALMGVTSAFAHAEPSSVTPQAGAVLNTPPTRVSMETVEEMALVAGANDLVVTGPNGVVSENPATVDPGDHSHISVGLQPNLGPGVYTVAWKTVSGDDGDAANGTWTFTYDPTKQPSAGSTAPPTAAPEASPASNGGPSPVATPPAAPATGSAGPPPPHGSAHALEFAEAGALFTLLVGLLGCLTLRHQWQTRRNRDTRQSRGQQ